MLPSARQSTPDPSLADLPIGVMVADDALAITYVNQTMLSAFQCGSSDVLDRDFIDLISPVDRRSAVALDRELSQTSTRVIDRLLVLAIGSAEHFVRAKLVRHQQQWQILVELLDDAKNVVHELYTEQLRWSAATRHSSDAVVIVDAHHKIVDFNERFFEIVAHRSEHGVLVGEEALRPRNLFSLPAFEGPAGTVLREQLDQEHVSTTSEVEINGRWYEPSVTSLRSPTGTTDAYAILLRDCTDRRQTEHERRERQRERLAHQNEIIASQQKAIRELSAPLLPIAHDVLVVPFIGALGRDRIREIVDGVMAGVASRGSKVVIFDLTGVPALDSSGAQGLVAAARTLRLIGARTILTGLSPNLAVLIVEEQISLDEIEVRSNLQDAVASVMRRSTRNT